MSRTFVCSLCDSTFESDISEEDAVAEYKKTFPDDSLEGKEVVCHGCYVEVMGWIDHELERRRNV